MGRNWSITFRDIASLVLAKPAQHVVLDPWHPALILLIVRLFGPLHGEQTDGIRCGWGMEGEESRVVYIPWTTVDRVTATCSSEHVRPLPDRAETV